MAVPRAMSRRQEELGTPPSSGSRSSRSRSRSPRRHHFNDPTREHGGWRGTSRMGTEQCRDCLVIGKLPYTSKMSCRCCSDQITIMHEGVSVLLLACKDPGCFSCSPQGIAQRDESRQARQDAQAATRQAAHALQKAWCAGCDTVKSRNDFAGKCWAVVEEARIIRDGRHVLGTPRSAGGPPFQWGTRGVCRTCFYDDRRWIS